MVSSLLSLFYIVLFVSDNFSLTSFHLLFDDDDDDDGV